MLKKLIKQFFVRRLGVPNQTSSLSLLQKQGFTPKTVFDVGAYKGDFAELAKSIWPETEVHCFEPLKEKAIDIGNRFKTVGKVHVHNVLLGEEDDKTVVFNKAETASSVLVEHETNDFEKEEKTMVSLDTLINESNLPHPDFLKLDTQGYEYQILSGAETSLQNIEVILAELNHIDIHQNVILAEEVISLLFSKGFVIFDIAEMHRRPLDQALWQTDFIFVKKNSSLRNSKSWS